MPVTRYAFDVLVDTPDGEVEHRVEVRAGDRLKAELEAGRQKLPERAQQHVAALWLWCAMVRTGLVEVGFQEWKNNHLIEFDRVKEADAEPDPTTEDQSD